MSVKEPLTNCTVKKQTFLKTALFGPINPRFFVAAVMGGLVTARFHAALQNIISAFFPLICASSSLRIQLELKIFNVGRKIIYWRKTYSKHF